MIFEAESQLDKQQKAEHGGVVRGTDAAKVQVGIRTLSLFVHPLPPLTFSVHQHKTAVLWKHVASI